MLSSLFENNLIVSSLAINEFSVNPAFIMLFMSLLGAFAKKFVRSILFFGALATIAYVEFFVDIDASRQIFFYGFVISYIAIISIFKTSNHFIEFIICSLYASFSIFIILSQNFLNILIFWELMAICSSVILFLSKAENAKKTASIYFMVHMLSGVFFVIGASSLYEITEIPNFRILNFSDIQNIDKLGEIFIAIGILINCAVIPISFWMTQSYKQSSKHSFMFLSIFTTKTAIFLAMFVMQGSSILFYFGVVMAVYAACAAFLLRRIRDILIYLMLSKLGLMLMLISSSHPESSIYISFIASSHVFYNSLIVACLVISYDSYKIREIHHLNRLRGSKYLFMVFLASIYVACGGFFTISYDIKQMLSLAIKFQHSEIYHIITIITILGNLPLIKLAANLFKKSNEANSSIHISFHVRLVVIIMLAILFVPINVWSSIFNIQYAFIGLESDLIFQISILLISIAVYYVLPKFNFSNLPDFDLVLVKLPKIIFCSIFSFVSKEFERFNNKRNILMSMIPKDSKALDASNINLMMIFIMFSIALFSIII